VHAERADTGETVRFSCGFLLGCTGYYRYDQGYLPEFPGRERFAGRIVHPQHWTGDVDYAGKRVVVIGSGATAVTLVPAMAEDAEHVTMVQRSPSYVISLPGTDPVADLLRRVLPIKVAYSIVRWKNVLMTMLFFQASRRWPRRMSRLIRKGVRGHLPEGYDVDTHFNPRYNPWDQRVCLVPDGDLFEAISAGRASIVTGEVEAFTESGVKLTSGEEVPADLIVTATGLNLLALGGMDVAVDGRPLDLPKTLAYKGMMLEGVPNFALAVGYTNASWTLKCDLTCEYVCRLLNHMDEHGFTTCAPRNSDPERPTLPFIDFTSGYVMRSIHKFPRQGTEAPWRLYQNYARDIGMIRYGRLDDGEIRFSRAASTPERTERAAA